MPTCPGCSKTVDSTRGLQTHKRQCKYLKAKSAQALTVFHNNRKQNGNHRWRRRAESLIEEVENNLAFDATPPIEQARSPSPLPPRPSGRPSRHIKLPKRYRDILPPPPPPIREPSPVRTPPPASPPHQPQPLEPFVTKANSFGVYHVYSRGRPSFTPDEHHSLARLSDSHKAGDNLDSRPWWNPLGFSIDTAASSYFAPFNNSTTFLLKHWQLTGSNLKSDAEIDRLVHDYMQRPDWQVEDLRKFSAGTESRRLDHFMNQPSLPFSVKDGWKHSSIKISVPGDGVKFKSEEEAHVFEVPGLAHRSLREVIAGVLNSPAASTFVVHPFKPYWQPTPESEPQRIFTDTFTADLFHAEYEKVSRLEKIDGVENVVFGIALWSDSTHLTNFGKASLWPIYLYPVNQWKSIRGKPTSFSENHLAYIPSLPDTFQDWYISKFGIPASAEIMKFARREIMMAVWLCLLDPEFMDAYLNGMLNIDSDSILRRWFPRFIFHGMDYPEKILMACIQYLAQYPCPRCLVHRSEISQLGGKLDRQRRQTRMRTDDERRRNTVEKARKLIFQKGYNVEGSIIKTLLKNQSLTSARNAFSVRLGPHGFDFHRIITSDILHEFEIGVFQAVFKHSIRILYAAGNDSIQTLNKRFRDIPTFGRDTIRKFSNDVAAMKKLAARDFEDILQCSIPAFESLLPEPHNTILLDLLFELATWHGLAKLKMHTESTLQDLDHSLARLGKNLREFKTVTCAAYITRELPGEVAARGRRKAALAAVKTVPALESQRNLQERSENGAKSGPRVREFNMSTIKLHGLGDYVATIREHGTTDNYSTQTGELAHRRVKRIFPVIQKSRFTLGIAKYEQRQRILQKIHEKSLAFTTHQKRKRVTRDTGDTPWLQFEDVEDLPEGSPEQHHIISSDVRHGLFLPDWLGANEDDPALKDFLPKLKDHCLAQLLNDDSYDGDGSLKYSATQRSHVHIVGNKIYRHKRMRINFTTYDCQRSQDTLNPRTHANAMVLSREDDDSGLDPFPYWFCRILGIFHLVVQYISPDSVVQDPQRIKVLWVRWYGREGDVRGSWKSRRLHKVGFVDSEDDTAFGFLDPERIIRGVHLIPSFCHGRTRELLPPSQSARAPSENDEDYRLYNIGMFVDRDMIMRFRGGGVGHKSTREATDVFLSDRHRTDERRDDDSNDKANDIQDTTIHDEEDDYGYEDPMDQRVSDDDDDGEADHEHELGEDDDLDELGPEDGDGDNDDAETLLGYGAF
ncbi:hypothetical protein H0H92_012339 [Tricholoma furcatifolium]|nr:hypothetical protein H0H92_012339 [Tricholoma furcatifolium]